ncbi:hypothetical protein PLICRDRAFT_195015 [Plicaturopsis crispa FD-325 SS-3]|nr:hypothetical protein PLICRDRAFT_195015 [Plicaturopsis crispa FD-325 SS-3]
MAETVFLRLTANGESFVLDHFLANVPHDGAFPCLKRHSKSSGASFDIIYPYYIIWRCKRVGRPSPHATLTVLLCIYASSLRVISTETAPALKSRPCRSSRKVICTVLDIHRSCFECILCVLSFFPSVCYRLIYSRLNHPNADRRGRGKIGARCVVIAEV